MADTPALGAGAARHGGSSPLPPTKIMSLTNIFCEAGRKLWDSFREDLNDGGNERIAMREAESVPSLKFSVKKILRQGKDSSPAHKFIIKV